MTRQEIEQRMDELAREYVDTHDKEIINAGFAVCFSLHRRSGFTVYAQF